MSTAAGPNFDESGLILYLDAANSKSYSGSGNVWNNLYPASNYSTNNLVNTTFASSPKSIYFGGTAYATFTDIAPVEQITITTMVYVDNWQTSTTAMTFVSNTGSDNQVYYRLGFNSPTNNTVGGNIRTASGTVTVNTPKSNIALGWRVLTMTFDGTTIALYVDGQSVSTTTVAKTTILNPTSSIVSVGAQRSFSTTNTATVGYISSVKIHNVALSASQVHEEYIALTAKFSFSEPTIVKENLDLWYDVANPKSYTGVGNNLVDLSGNNRTGSLISSPTYLSSPARLSFNGSAQYVAAPTTSITSAFADSTLECWAYIKLPSKGPLIGIGYGLDGHYIGIGPDPFSYGGSVFAYEGQYVILSVLYTQSIMIGNQLTNPGWYHFALSRSNASFTLYVNGQVWGTGATAPGNNPSTGSYIGYARYYGSPPEFFSNNSVAVGRIYSKALSSTEVQQNFNVERGRYGV